jgi:hypothetical protein
LRLKHKQLRGRLLLCASLLSLLAVLGSSSVANAQGCGISLEVVTSEVNYPSSAIPHSGSTTFGQLFDVSYSPTFANSTLVLQFLNGSTWQSIGTFSGNGVGFTEIAFGLVSSWAHFGTNSVRVQSGGCASNVSSFSIGYDPSALEVDVLGYAALVALVVAFLLLGRKLGWKRFVILAVPVYLVLSPWTGQRYDVYFLISSGVRILQHVNPFDPGNPPLYPSPLKWAYPPLYPLYSAFSYLAYQAFTGASLPTVAGLTWPGWLTSTYNVYLAFVPPSLPVLALLLKLPMIASAILTGLLLKRMTGNDSAAIWWVANPLVILVAAIWGQLDPMATLFAVGALYYFRQGKEPQAYLFASFGAAVKVWPALMIPIILAVSARKKGLRALKPTVWVLPALLLTALLYASYGNLLNTLFVFVYARGIPTFAGAFTVNGLTWQEILFVMNSPPIPLFLAAGLPSYAAMLLWIYKRGDEDIARWTVLSILIFFLTYNYVNPQYFYWVLPFLVLQGKRMARLVFTAMPLVFLMISYNVFYFISPAILPDYFSLGASIVEQLKLSVFFQNTWFFVAVSGVVPTIVYVLTLYEELKPDWVVRIRSREFVPEDKERLIPEPVEGRNP